MFITNEPALVINDSLIISDLHLGITRELRFSGVHIPSQVTPLAKKINSLKKKTNTKRLVILGDVRHNIPTVSWQEFNEIPEFFRKIDFKEIVVTKGNHDGNIESLVDDFFDKNIKIKKSTTIGDYYLTHGHRIPTTKKKKIIIGHNHPKIMFRDDLGSVYFERVWVISSGKRETIIMPSFNELSGSMVINDSSLSDRVHKTFMGPIAKNIKNPRIFLLDGTDLGHLNDLKIKKR
ncbi:metallophosphoesterase [Candidatus Aenigmatarchaeota archaeon]